MRRHDPNNARNITKKESAEADSFHNIYSVRSKLLLPQAVEIAVRVYRDGLFVGESKDGFGSLADLEVLAVESLVALESHPKDAVLLCHGVLDRSDRYLDEVALDLRYGDVLLVACLDYAGHELSHLLAATHYRHAVIFYLFNYVSAVLTYKKFNVVFHYFILQRVVCFVVTILYHIFERFSVTSSRFRKIFFRKMNRDRAVADSRYGLAERLRSDVSDRVNSLDIRPRRFIRDDVSALVEIKLTRDELGCRLSADADEKTVHLKLAPVGKTDTRHALVRDELRNRTVREEFDIRGLREGIDVNF